MTDLDSLRLRLTPRQRRKMMDAIGFKNERPRLPGWMVDQFIEFILWDHPMDRVVLDRLADGVAKLGCPFPEDPGTVTAGELRVAMGLPERLPWTDRTTPPDAPRTTNEAEEQML